MALHDWSMNMLGYPAHQRSGARVVGMTHMSTHMAFKVAQQLGFGPGWLRADSDQPHLEGLEPDQTLAVELSDLFVQQRVAYTEGIVSGSVVFGADDGAVLGAAPQPPSDRDLVQWTETGGRAWMQVVDNENVFFGGLSDDQIGQLLCWFLTQRPLETEWSETALEERSRDALIRGLFQHGWTRNYSLVVTGWRPTVDLWGGIHTASALECDEMKRLTGVQIGIRGLLKGGVWTIKPLEDDEECPLDDETGRATPRLSQ